MIIWINGAFGSGKTTTAFELYRRLPGSFVYDPENVGCFIRKNAPESFSKGDFQDIPLWREMNYKIIKMLVLQHDGDIIVPMTLINPGYYNEIVGKLLDDGIDLRHFILYASREEILRRLRSRSFRFIGRESFATSMLDCCVAAFDTIIPDEKINTERMGVDEVVEQIAALCGLELLHDKRTKFGKQLCRLRVMIKHLR